MKTKKCSKCGIEKLVSEFYKNRSMPDGLDIYCKSCRYGKKKTVWICYNGIMVRSLDLIKIDLREKTKLCSKCGEWKPFNMFHKKNDGIAGVAAECKKCAYERDLERKNKDLEGFLKKQREYQRARYKPRPLKPTIDHESKTRFCNTCKRWLPFECFRKIRASEEKLYSVCNDCVTNKNRSKEYIENLRKWQSEYRKRDKEQLTDHYIKQIITNASGIKMKSIPPELVELKRVQLQIKRYLKETSA